MSDKGFRANGATASQVRVSAMLLYYRLHEGKDKNSKIHHRKGHKGPRRGRGLALLFL